MRVPTAAHDTARQCCGETLALHGVVVVATLPEGQRHRDAHAVLMMSSAPSRQLQCGPPPARWPTLLPALPRVVPTARLSSAPPSVPLLPTR